MKKAIRQSGHLFANLQWFLRPSLLVMVFYWLCRIAFLLKYPIRTDEIEVSQVLEFIVLSLRFDASLFISVSMLPLLLLVFGNSYRFKQTARLLFTAGNGIFLLFNTIDLYFFAFNGRRTDWPALRFLLEDAIRQLPQLTMHYPMVPMLAAGSAWLIWHAFPEIKLPEKSVLAPLWIRFTAGLIVLTVCILVIRNSVGEKPLLPGNAFVLRPQQAGHAALNTGFVMLKTMQSAELERAAFLDEKESERLLYIKEEIDARMKGRNLVLIILESFATEYTGLEHAGANQTPFLDSLARAGIFFPNHFASGRTSRDALPSILASVPPWMDESFSGSPYVSVPIEGLGSSLRNAGYQTAFFHGGKNGTMSFDYTSRICGFDRYFGMNEYPDDSDYDGNWGIFDLPFLQFSAREINTFKQPFAAGIFTLSSHQPYTLPSGWKDTVGTGGQAVYKAIRYADQSLRSFFKTASGMPWYRNTLFVITADHTHQILKPEYQNYPGWYDVPLVLFAPDAKPVADSSRWLQHTDIRPLILNMLGIKSHLGNPLGTGGNKGLLPMQYQDGNYHVIHPEGLLIWDGKKPGQGWRWEGFRQKKEPAGLRKQTMARLQYFRNGLLDNRLFR
jgi:uncharacterized sulfatase